MNEGWGILCVVGSWCWVGAVIGLALTAFPVRGVINTRAASFWGTCLIIFYVLWIAAMLHA